MGTKYKSRDEQIKLIMECRTSGLSDYQWCDENGINKSTFYNWITRLRKRGYQFPDSAETVNPIPDKHQIIKVNVLPQETEATSIIEKQNTRTLNSIITEPDTSTAVEIQMTGATVRFFNNTNPAIIKYTLECLGGITHAW